MNLVSLERLNDLRFPEDPKPLHKLQRLCRLKKLPAVKVGGEWHVDLDVFDLAGLSPQARKVVEQLKRTG